MPQNGCLRRLKNHFMEMLRHWGSNLNAWNDHRKMNRKFEIADLSKAQMLVLVKEYLGRAGACFMPEPTG